MSLHTNQTESFQKNVRQAGLMENYYRFQSTIYDSTRWSFLFGRDMIIRRCAELVEAKDILEVGCGTGYNLKRLAKCFPQANILGVDISQSMLDKASNKLKSQKNIQLSSEAYGSKERKNSFDLILFSYSLSMINPHWDQLLESAKKDLKPGGHIAILDFESSQYKWFKNHMANHHVRMEKHLMPNLLDQFILTEWDSKLAYAGLWNYFYFIGSNPI